MDSLPTTNYWNALRESLAGSFTADARGLFAGSFVLLRAGDEEFGRLDVNSTAGADLKAGGIEAEIRQISGHGYRMTYGGSEILTAKRERGSADRLKISCGGRVYKARTSFLRNNATAGSDGGEVARINGSLSGRRYEVAFEPEDEWALAAAFFLLYHTAAHRRRAYLASR